MLSSWVLCSGWFGWIAGPARCLSEVGAVAECRVRMVAGSLGAVVGGASWFGATFGSSQAAHMRCSACGRQSAVDHHACADLGRGHDDVGRQRGRRHRGLDRLVRAVGDRDGEATPGIVRLLDTVTTTWLRMARCAGTFLLPDASVRRRVQAGLGVVVGFSSGGSGGWSLAVVRASSCCRARGGPRP